VHDEKLCTLRTRSIYDEQVSIVSNQPALCSVYGVKFSTVLNELRNFQIVVGAPSEIAHDLFDGVIFYSLTVLLNHCVYNAFNNKLKTCPFVGLQARNKPGPVIGLTYKKRLL